MQIMSLPGESKASMLCHDPLGNYEWQVLETELLQCKTWGICIDLDLEHHFKNEVKVQGFSCPGRFHCHKSLLQCLRKVKCSWKWTPIKWLIHVMSYSSFHLWGQDVLFASCCWQSWGIKPFNFIHMKAEILVQSLDSRSSDQLQGDT